MSSIALPSQHILIPRFEIPKWVRHLGTQMAGGMGPLAGANMASPLGVTQRRAVAAHWSLLLIVVAFFALVYGPTIEKERVKISALFPDAYPRWEQNVPAFVPRPTPWRDPSVASTERFSPSLYMRHGEWKAALGFILALAWLVLRMRGDLW